MPQRIVLHSKTQRHSFIADFTCAQTVFMLQIHLTCGSMSQACTSILGRTSRSDLWMFGQARGCLATEVFAVSGSQTPCSIATRFHFKSIQGLRISTMSLQFQSFLLNFILGQTCQWKQWAICLSNEHKIGAEVSKNYCRRKAVITEYVQHSC